MTLLSLTLFQPANSSLYFYSLRKKKSLAREWDSSYSAKDKNSECFIGCKLLKLEAVRFTFWVLKHSFRELPVKYFQKCALPRIVNESHKALNYLCHRVTVVTCENNFVMLCSIYYMTGRASEIQCFGKSH